MVWCKHSHQGWFPAPTVTVRLEKGHQEPVLAQPRQEPGEGLPPKGRESSDLQGSRAPARSHLAASGIRALLPLHPQELTTEPELVVVLGALQQATHTQSIVQVCFQEGHWWIWGVWRRQTLHVMLWKTPNKEGVLVLRMFAPDTDWGKDSQGTGRGREDGDGRTK